MLDLDPDEFAADQALPRGWHFILMGADTPRSALRTDGFPGLGIPMPDLGLPRLMLGGRSVQFLRDIPIDSAVRRTSVIKDVSLKSTQARSMAVVTIEHSLSLLAASDPALIETQTYLLLADKGPTPQQRAGGAITSAVTKTLVPDETLLFQYSALGFNSHKIHIDRAYATGVEGFPDLVVNGGLTTLLLTEFARRELALSLVSFSMKNVAPLFCGRPITLAADRGEGSWSLKAHDEVGRLAAVMEVQAA